MLNQGNPAQAFLAFIAPLNLEEKISCVLCCVDEKSQQPTARDCRLATDYY